jgi:hypothetical protein
VRREGGGVRREEGGKKEPAEKYKNGRKNRKRKD